MSLDLGMLKILQEERAVAVALKLWLKRARLFGCGCGCGDEPCLSKLKIIGSDWAVAWLLSCGYKRLCYGV